MNDLIKLAAASILYKLATQPNIQQLIAMQMELERKRMMLAQMQAEQMQAMSQPNRPEMMGKKYHWLGTANNLANMRPVQQTQQQLQGQKFGR